jgi:phage shock protein A
MERTVWTDERLEDRFSMTDQRFEELIARMDRLEARMERLEARMDDLYRQMNTFMIANFTALLTIAVLVIART